MSRDNYEIEKLKKKLDDSHESIASYNIKYRELQDKIDKLNKKAFNSKNKLREVASTINDILKKLDSEIHKINMTDFKTLDNKKIITLIHSAVRLINFKLKYLFPDK